MMNEYLNWIRSFVGQQKIIIVYASACICDENKRLLWQLRNDFKVWGLPGGILELNETLPQCVVREVYEETGLKVKPERLVGVYSSPQYEISYPNGDQVQQVSVCFQCRLMDGECQADGDESLKLTWIEEGCLPPTASWYDAMANDLWSGNKSATFDRGSAGDAREDKPYIQFLRQYVGKETIIVPTTSAFIQDEDGRVLLQRRGDVGLWGLPGGGMELGERIDETIVSEVREETGLEVRVKRLIGVYADQPQVRTYPNGDRTKMVDFVFDCQICGGTLHADGVETLEVNYFSRQKLPKMVSHMLPYLEDAYRGIERTIF